MPPRSPKQQKPAAHAPRPDSTYTPDAGLTATEAATAAQAGSLSPVQALALQRVAGNQAVAHMVQRQANRTGMPDELKSGIENLSGMDMSDVRVHRNSSQPAQLNAHAYTQGSDIHVGPGQDRQLPHEAWHVTQQRQGRVRPTTSVSGTPVNDGPSLEKEADVMGQRAVQRKEGVPINDDPGLEKEADVMGQRAVQRVTASHGRGAGSGQ